MSEVIYGEDLWEEFAKKYDCKDCLERLYYDEETTVCYCKFFGEVNPKGFCKHGRWNNE